jgi:4-hydroxy-tetrahydrodipicolinate synthase
MMEYPAGFPAPTEPRIPAHGETMGHSEEIPHVVEDGEAVPLPQRHSLFHDRAFTSLVTPLLPGGEEIDWEALDRLIDRQVMGGASGIIVGGPTSEASTLTSEEHLELIEWAVKRTRGAIPVLAGTGSNSTKEARLMTRYAHECGASGVVLITPYANMPTQTGLISHYLHIADDVDLPMMLHNNPDRTGVRLEIPTLKTLAAHPRIQALEDSSGSLDFGGEVIKKTGLKLFSGTDNMMLPYLAIGATGAVSVASNIIPSWATWVVRAALEGDWDRAREIMDPMYPVVEALTLETNPIPVKAALEMLGLIHADIRSPLTALSERPRLLLRDALVEAGLLAR